jgi:hypothetical protein
MDISGFQRDTAGCRRIENVAAAKQFRREVSLAPDLF